MQGRCDVSGNLPPLWIEFPPQACSFFTRRKRRCTSLKGIEVQSDLAGCEREEQNRPIILWREHADAHQVGGREPRVQQLATEGGLGFKGTGTYWVNEAPQEAPTLEATQASAASQGRDHVHGSVADSIVI